MGYKAIKIPKLPTLGKTSMASFKMPKMPKIGTDAPKMPKALSVKGPNLKFLSKTTKIPAAPKIKIIKAKIKALK